jgi:hypothetical protein
MWGLENILIDAAFRIGKVKVQQDIQNRRLL